MAVLLDHIELRDGVAYIKGQHVKVRMVAQMYLSDSTTIEQVMEQYSLSHAQVYAALAYYYDHKAEFDARAQAMQPLIDAARQASNERRERLRRNLQARDE